MASTPTVDEILKSLGEGDLTKVQKNANAFRGCGAVHNSRHFHDYFLRDAIWFDALTWTASHCPALQNCRRLLVGHRGSLHVAKKWPNCKARYIRGSHAKLYIINFAPDFLLRVFVGSYNLTNPTISDLMVEVQEKLATQALIAWFDLLWKNTK